ncbi:MAG: hypothetical protein ACP5VE_08400 [Chthonomonadales bacterium]
MKKQAAAAACLLALFAAGCSHQDGPKPKTPSQIQAEMDKVRNDPKMPPNIKNMVLGHLQGEMQRVQQNAGR